MINEMLMTDPPPLASMAPNGAHAFDQSILIDGHYPVPLPGARSPNPS